jgi:hypothetical protein
MDNDPIFNTSRGNSQPIEGATYRPDVNALDDQYQRQQHQQSEYQRFLRQHNHPASGNFGFASYDQALEDKYRPLLPQVAFTEPPEERPDVLHQFSTVHNPDFRRFMTPPTSPELPAILPAAASHDIAKPLPDIIPYTTQITDERWYSDAFYAGTMLHSRTNLHQLEQAFICNKIGLPTEVLLLEYQSKFPLTPFSNAFVRTAIHAARWRAKCLVWNTEEINTLRKAMVEGKGEDDAWLALRAKWRYYPKDRVSVSRKYNEIQQELANGAVWQGYDEDEQLLADLMARWPEPQG